MSESKPNRRGILIILSSPSGAGKSTLAKRLMAWDPSLKFSVSATTRAPRPGEEDGREYYFKTHDEFQKMVEEGEMLEHAQVFDHFYGSPKAPVEDAIKAGRDVLFDIDWQGGQQIRNSTLADDVVSIFVLPPSIAELESRLRSRAQDSDEVIAGRMRKSRDEISHWAEYDYVLVNTDVDKAELQMISIVSAERQRRSRQPGLVELVRGLNTEFEERT
ncbi:guanylate kinase [Pseudohalocynthiibacter aestuariivivens]|jgi:guanylate kinase|uniref:Guanylate kinase n=1 Tax=Pseudohalocynthiibacter aestuariivivens TaxID=1591409 RepID=A0ABV5JFU0_9RHOB|nr:MULTISPECIES: guanylate kinase [Pseudohalocynthiibacter]MBS9716337.1 guanylate kinase [Pseudohalocynthiibacter aestuariivivens]MCK0100855.1 guanylate kinase [Pseudohalocynthiibacter sp. F2068]